MAAQADAKRYRTVSPGEIIFREGEPGREMFYVMEGEVVIFREMEGREVIITTLTSGDIFGEMALVSAENRTASAKAQKLTRLLVLDKAAFLRKIQESPEFSLRLIRTFSERLEKVTDELAVLKFVISG
ncbi:cyclic nucleotide-binding domain-containing protein [Dissulfurirhabdus thermomarina]|uniref:Cyclic nucleotide-binding domain-containing protein n=1 Tax=Dissulfurirhabdus thermomarina TaxID=1765737 RepID=A0A6N9TTH4_DISTH|nr:cyclic nucleotide-binding domain-containing protein [Dissulfurirhabdus thermomarina]NDY42737.1 cyclic nucleotide-binding domain-containing protein [Dissulfurirhabdus thermomarina]NMX22556.1 cyclic nucleotide-binding domain-containing protein [Dissulfurirhabdus thermomarina]